MVKSLPSTRMNLQAFPLEDCFIDIEFDEKLIESLSCVETVELNSILKLKNGAKRNFGLRFMSF